MKVLENYVRTNVEKKYKNSIRITIPLKWMEALWSTFDYLKS